MRSALCWLLVGIFISSGQAEAHAPFDGALGFYGGFLHPFLTPAHALAVAGIGLLAGQHSLRWRWQVPAVYSGAIFLSFAGLPYVPSTSVPVMMLLVAGSVCGAAVAIARPLPYALICLLAAVIGLALGIDSAPGVAGINESLVALLGTLSGATVLLMLIVEFSMSCRHEWIRLGVRVVSAWIAASSMLIIALVL
jgi:urease accessory protein